MSDNAKTQALMYSGTATNGPDAEENLDSQILLCKTVATERDGDAEVVRDIA